MNGSKSLDQVVSIESLEQPPDSGYPFLCGRAEEFVRIRGVAEEAPLISYLFGSGASPDLWRPVLRFVLKQSGRLEELHDGAWRCITTSASGSALSSFVVLDVETTGLGPLKHRVIEIGLVRFQHGVVVERFTSLCQPDRRLPSFITKLTGITDSDLADAPRFGDIALQVLNFIGNDVIVGHNVTFDVSFISAELKRLGQPPLINDSLDTMTLGMRLLANLKRLSLDRLATAVGLSPRTLHRALDDAELTGNVMLALLGRAAEVGANDLASLKALANCSERAPRAGVGRGNALLKRDLLVGIPSTPGVYIMCDKNDRVIYVGKAKQLRGRVRSYYSEPLGYTRKLDGLLELVEKIDIEQTGSELHALLLESQLIRWHQPRFNTVQRASEEYPYIRIDVTNLWPKVALCRSRKLDGARYFGPYRSSKTGRLAVDLISDLFPLRTCNRSFKNARSYGRPCLRLDMRKCLGPCVGAASSEEYRNAVNAVIHFLEGDDSALMTEIQQQLEIATSALDFERCRVLRNNLRTLESVSSAARELRQAESRGLTCVVSHDAETSTRRFSIILNGRQWSTVTIRRGDRIATLAKQAERSLLRWKAVGHRPIDQDSLDATIILNRWLIKHDGAPFVHQFDEIGSADWRGLFAWARRLTDEELDADRFLRISRMVDKADSDSIDEIESQGISLVSDLVAFTNVE